jgi:hypothetical protein
MLVVRYVLRHFQEIWPCYRKVAIILISFYFIFVILDVAVLENAFSVPGKFMVEGIDPAPETSCILEPDNRLVHHNFGVYCYTLGRRPTVVDFCYYAIVPYTTPRAAPIPNLCVLPTATA